MHPADRPWRVHRRGMTSFPDPEWFVALGRLMEAEGEEFRRLGYAETRCAIRVLPDAEVATASTGDPSSEVLVGLEFDGYALPKAVRLDDVSSFDPDFVICGRAAIWRRMLDEIARDGRPELRHTLNSLV